MNARRTLRALLVTAGAVAIASPVVATAQTNRVDGLIARPPNLRKSNDGPPDVTTAQRKGFDARILPPSRGNPDDGPPLLDLKLESSYVAAGETQFRGAKFGDSGALGVNLNASTMMPLSENWMLPLGLQSQNISFDSLSGLPLPDRINTLKFSTGLAYKPNDNWMIMARINPGLYKLEDIGANDIGITGGLMAKWQYSPAVEWTFGFMVNPDGDLPVIPLVGVNWLINEKWELQLMLLKPRVIYTLNDQWKFNAGMGLNFGTTFRTSDTLGTSIDLPRYNDALASYSDMRFGVGAEYQLNKSWSFEAEAGYSINREIDYKDIDEKVKFGNAPYFRLGLKFEF